MKQRTVSAAEDGSIVRPLISLQTAGGGGGRGDCIGEGGGGGGGGGEGGGGGDMTMGVHTPHVRGHSRSNLST